MPNRSIKSKPKAKVSPGIMSLFWTPSKSKSEYIQKYSDSSYTNDQLKDKHRSFTDKATRSGAETIGRATLSAKTLGLHELGSVITKTGSITKAASNVRKADRQADAINEVLNRRGDSERYAANRTKSLAQGSSDSVWGRKTTSAVSNSAARHVEVSALSLQVLWFVLK